MVLPRLDIVVQYVHGVKTYTQYQQENQTLLLTLSFCPLQFSIFCI